MEPRPHDKRRLHSEKTRQTCAVQAAQPILANTALCFEPSGSFLPVRSRKGAKSRASAGIYLYHSSYCCSQLIAVCIVKTVMQITTVGHTLEQQRPVCLLHVAQQLWPLGAIRFVPHSGGVRVVFHWNRNSAA